MFRSTTLLSGVIGGAALVGLASCSDISNSLPTSPAKSGGVAPTTLVAGDTVPLAVLLRGAPSGGAAPFTPPAMSSMRVTSSNPSIASIADDGRIIALDPGTTIISVTTSAGTSSALLSVQPAFSSWGTTVTVTIDSSSIAIDGTAQATAVVRDANGNVLSGRTVTWASGNAKIATVSSSGAITGVSAGSVMIRATYGRRSGSASITVRASSGTTSASVASVSVTLASTSLSPGQTTQATATLRDSAGNTISGPTVSWTSSNTSVATVSVSGVVTAVANGSANIIASSGGKSGASTITVTGSASPPPGYTTPNIVSANFDDSTAGAFINDLTTSLTFPKDPTNSGRGRVAAFRYSGTGPQQDINKALEYDPSPSLSFGSTFYFGGDLYFPNGTVNFTNGAVQRKLLYYRTIANGLDIFFVVHLWGDQMQVEWSGDGGDKVSPSALATLQMGQWYRIETQVTMNSSMSASDGVIRVWVNGSLIYENTAVRFTNPSWTSTPFWQVWWVGQQREGSDTGGSGPVESSIDETRYWDNIGFSTTRIGPSPNGP